MPKGVPKRKHSGEFKQQVIEAMRSEGLSFMETSRRFGISDRQVRSWERIYLEEGTEGLYIERRGRARGSGKGRPPKLPQEIEKDLIAENQRLRAENDYLKKLHALVLTREQHEKKRRQSGN